jgi:hypothetical protein
MAKKEKPKSLDELVTEWKSAKRAEEAGKTARLIAESAIVDRVQTDLPEKGTYHVPAGGGLKISTGKSVKWDQAELTGIQLDWDETQVDWPFSVEWKPDNKALAYIEEHRPEFWKKIIAARSEEEKKPSFSEGK